MTVPVDDAATWRPLSERGVGQLADSLNKSPLRARLIHWATGMAIEGYTPFHRSGFNRARHVRLVAAAAVGTGMEPQHPVEAIAVAELPSTYGTPATALQVTLDVIIRANAYLAAMTSVGTVQPIRLSVPDLYTTLDAMIGALTDPGVVDALAGLAGIDPVLVPLPANLHFVTGPNVRELLYLERLVPIPDAGPSHGANLLANPTLDLANPAERRSQLDDWLQQIALDAGLSGMEGLLAAYHQEA